VGRRILKEQWDKYTEKYLALNIKEQSLILLAGIIVFSMVIFTYAIEGSLALTTMKNKQRIQLTSENSATGKKIIKLDNTLVKDPNIAVNKKINEYQDQLLKVDGRLLKLTSDLIDPIEMRQALLELLKLEKGVKLLSFKAMPVQPLWLNDADKKNNTANSGGTGANKESETANSGSTNVVGLYRHGIQLVLQGQYFQLRDYLLQLEDLSWTFFWQKFYYTAEGYPLNVLEIEIYSLSTSSDFIGV
jgi:MSHA biogenesis protein MshJ